MYPSHPSSRPEADPLPSTGFSPHEVHDKQSFFGWILPTLRTSEFTVLQIVGLDAAVVRSVSLSALGPS